MMTHEPVLLEEVVEALHIYNQGYYIDCTEGAGGYSMAIAKAGGTVLGLDADPFMLTIAKKNLVGIQNVKLIQGNFRDVKRIASGNGFSQVDGIVFDLGVSNIHFMDPTRGFSFKNPEAKLDMRLDPITNSVRASDLLNVLRQDQLGQMFGKKLGGQIVEFRQKKKFETVGDFLSLFPEKKGQRIHPATTAFLSLRIAVNSELDNLRDALPGAYELLKPGGKLVVVSFHSLEDRIVKEFMKAKGNVDGPIRPTDEEVGRNPKARSAVLRVLTKK